MFGGKIQPQINEYGNYSGPDFEYEDDEELYRQMVEGVRGREEGLIKKLILKIIGKKQND